MVSYLLVSMKLCYVQTCNYHFKYHMVLSLLTVNSLLEDHFIFHLFASNNLVLLNHFTSNSILSICSSYLKSSQLRGSFAYVSLNFKNFETFRLTSIWTLDNNYWIFIYSHCYWTQDWQTWLETGLSWLQFAKRNSQ